MGVESVLGKVERDISAGDLGKARDRLHGLLSVRPDDLEVRRRLGKVYWELQHPAMAGRYWYLEEDKTPEMDSAAKAFERACGGDAALMLHALKFKGDIGAVQEAYARDTLLALQSRAASAGYHYDFGTGVAKGHAPTYEQTLSDKLIPVGCLFLTAVGLTLMLIGLKTVLDWLF